MRVGKITTNSRVGFEIKFLPLCSQPIRTRVAARLDIPASHVLELWLNCWASNEDSFIMNLLILLSLKGKKLLLIIEFIFTLVCNKWFILLYFITPNLYANLLKYLWPTVCGLCLYTKPNDQYWLAICRSFIIFHHRQHCLQQTFPLFPDASALKKPQSLISPATRSTQNFHMSHLHYLQPCLYQKTINGNAKQRSQATSTISHLISLLSITYPTTPLQPTNQRASWCLMGSRDHLIVYKQQTAPGVA